MCGHHPLSPCIIWLSRPVNWTMVMPFSDCARIYIQWRHLHILQAVLFFFYNFMLHNWITFFSIKAGTGSLNDLSGDTEQTVILKTKVKTTSSWFLTRLHEHVSPDIVEFFLILPALWCFFLLNWIRWSKAHSKELCWQAYVSFLTLNAHFEPAHLLLQLPLITLAAKVTAAVIPLCSESH